MKGYTIFQHIALISILGGFGIWIYASYVEAPYASYILIPLVIIGFLYSRVDNRRTLKQAKENLASDLAKIQHEAWRQLPQNKGSPWDIPFEALPELQVDKNVAGVTAVLSELKRRGLLR